MGLQLTESERRLHRHPHLHPHALLYRWSPLLDAIPMQPLHLRFRVNPNRTQARHTAPALPGSKPCPNAPQMAGLPHQVLRYLLDPLGQAGIESAKGTASGTEIETRIPNEAATSAGAVAEAISITGRPIFKKGSGVRQRQTPRCPLVHAMAARDLIRENRSQALPNHRASQPLVRLLLIR